MVDEKIVVCPYKAKDTNNNHVFYYIHGNSVLYCENIECSNLNKDKATFIGGEGRGVGICTTSGEVEQGLVKKITETGFFQKLDAERKEEDRKDREQAVLDEMKKASQ